MGWKDIPKPKPTLPGQWEEYGVTGIRVWGLRCPPCFLARVSESGGLFYMEVNSKGYGPHPTLEAAQIAAETRIAADIRAVLPVYKLLVERLDRRHDRNIIPMKSRDRDDA